MKYTLDSSGNVVNNTIWKQAWLSVDELNILYYWTKEWQNFVAQLQKGHIKLSKNSNQLIWNFINSNGEYTAKLGYLLSTTWDIGINPTWWKYL